MSIPSRTDASSFPQHGPQEGSPPGRARGLPRLSQRAMTLYAVVTAITFSASSSAPTPLYHIYQHEMALSPLVTTLVFAAYAVTMVLSFLTVARLSDHVGRRPMILAGLATNALAFGFFLVAGGGGMLIAARLVQGIAVGIGMATLGATILDTDRVNGPVYNSVTAFIGLMVGSAVSGGLIAFAPFPTHLIYVVLLAVTLAEAVALIFAPETVTRKAGALRVLVPNVTIPQAARASVARLLPLNVAAWALGGFYLSLMPSLVAAATGVTSPLVGASVVSVVMLSAATSVFALRRLPPERLLRLGAGGLALGVAATLAAVTLQSVVGMFLGTALAGVGFGASYSGNLRTLLPLAREHERAGLLAAYFVVSYLSFSIPALLAGVGIAEIGLIATSQIYGAALIVLALLSARPGRRRRLAMEG